MLVVVETDNSYTGHNTKEKLKDIPVSIINEVLPTKEDRKAVQLALKQIGSGQVSWLSAVLADERQRRRSGLETMTSCALSHKVTRSAPPRVCPLTKSLIQRYALCYIAS